MVHVIESKPFDFSEVPGVQKYFPGEVYQTLCSRSVVYRSLPLFEHVVCGRCHRQLLADIAVTSGTHKHFAIEG